MIQWGKVTQFFSYVRPFFQAKALGVDQLRKVLIYAKKTTVGE